MTQSTFPSPIPAHRTADRTVHAIGLVLIVTAGTALLSKAAHSVSTSLLLALATYVICALASNLASWAYHFSPRHDQRAMLRRIDHAAIYSSITGTFTPFFVIANTTWTLFLLVLCWVLSLLAMWNKITNPTIKSRWSTASYLALGAIGLCALPDLTNVPAGTGWCVLGGALAYVIGTVFYARKTLPFRYAIWHAWVNIGALLMFAGIWLALSSLM
ncbi:MAG: hemolysin III family protein [Pseudomonadota bacterium]